MVQQPRASTSGLTLFIMSSCIASLTARLHCSHAMSRCTPSAAFTSARFTNRATAAVA